MSLKLVIIVGIFTKLAISDNVGWKSYLVENPIEFHDIPLKWEHGNQTKVPNWLSGIYARNGPAQHTFGSSRRHLSSWLDGFAKIHTFKLDGQKVYFSGKMLESTTYMDSVAKGELVPQIMLNPFVNPDEDWSLFEVTEILQKQYNQWNGDMTHNGYDNNNPALWRFGSKDDPWFLAMTDTAWPQRFDINSLKTLELLRPHDAMEASGGTAHWMREPNTDNSITFTYRSTPTNPFDQDYVEVIRFTPENTEYDKPEVVAKFYPSKNSMVHSFSVTENYAVFFYYPVVIAGATCLMAQKFHVLNCLEHVDEPTEIFIVNLKTGEVQDFKDETVFSQHHINAFESSDGNQIYLDISPGDFFGLRDYVAMENMLNPPEISIGTNGSTCGDKDVTRYTIDLNALTISAQTFPNTLDDSVARYINKFDFPTINEAYRGKEYCIIYGWSAYDYSRTALIKKNVCDPTQDRVLYIENHYASEMSFIPNPDAKSEDDGVLVTITFDGEREQSYFAVIDAVSFEILDKAWLPHFIPWSAHGMYFPEAKWTLQG